MANIEYGSEVEFIDWSHAYVDLSSSDKYNMYQVRYQQDPPTYPVVSDSSFYSGYAIENHSDIAYANTSGGVTPPSLPSVVTNKFTFAVWVRWPGPMMYSDTYGVFNMKSHDGTNDTRGNLCIGYYHPDDPSQVLIGWGGGHGINNMIYPRKDGYITSYTLPNNSTKNDWHHFAMTNDCQNIYFFVDGKMIYSEPVRNNGTFGLYHMAPYKGYDGYRNYFNDYFIMKDVCLWTEDFEVPDAPLYEKFDMKNIGDSGWVPPQPTPKVTNILKVY